MAKGCKDCSECTRSGLGKLFRGTIRLGAAVSTAGATEVVKLADKKLLSNVCPECGHKMGLHTINVKVK